MYREKRDLVEKQDKVLDICGVSCFPKRSQRRGMWRKLWKGERELFMLSLL